MQRKMPKWHTVEEESFFFASHRYDINKAKQILKVRQDKGKEVIDTVPVASLKDFISEPGKHQVLKFYVDWDRITENPDQFDLTVPLIMAITPEACKQGDQVNTAMPIDGYHRIALAVIQGVEELPYVILNKKETRSILNQ